MSTRILIIKPIFVSLKQTILLTIKTIIIMKKTLLIIAVACMAFVEVNAQQIWNFGNDATNFPVYAGLGIGTGTPISTPGATETILGFTVSAGLAASATTGAVSAQ